LVYNIFEEKVLKVIEELEVITIIISVFREIIDIKNIKNMNFFNKKKKLQKKLNNSLDFLKIEDFKFRYIIKNNILYYVLFMKISHQKNYFFSDEKLRNKSINFNCKKILFAFLNIRSNSQSIKEKKIKNISFKFFKIRNINNKTYLN
jgi:hypothetical protein